MAPISLETEDHSRDASFNKAMHGRSAEAKAGLRAMLKKDPDAQKAAVDEYFKHWDNKSAGTETQETREVGLTCLGSPLFGRFQDAENCSSQARKAEYATLTRQ